MPTWSTDELATIGEAAELRLASHRPDGTLRPYVTIWVVRSGDGLYVRSAYGPENPWFVRARASGTGRITAGGVEHDVTFADADADPAARAAVDDAYHAKYDRYGPALVDTVVGERAHGQTIELLPRD
jgi:hypothetical protein